MKPNSTGQFKREPLTRDEAATLTKVAIGDGSRKYFRSKLIICTLLDTGLRVDEFCRLKHNQIDWQRKTATIIGKGQKRRVIPLSSRVMQMLEAWFYLHGDIGIQPRMVELLVKDIAKEAGITKPCSPHVLRHTFAVQSLQDGISLAGLQKVLGHSSIRTTAIYLNLSNEEAMNEYREKRKGY